MGVLKRRKSGGTGESFFSSAETSQLNNLLRGSAPVVPQKGEDVPQLNSQGKANGVLGAQVRLASNKPIRKTRGPDFESFHLCRFTCSSLPLSVPRKRRQPEKQRFNSRLHWLRRAAQEEQMPERARMSSPMTSAEPWKLQLDQRTKGSSRQKKIKTNL